MICFLIGIAVGAGAWEVAGRYLHYGSIGQDLIKWVRSWR